MTDDDALLAYWLMRRFHWTFAELNEVASHFGSLRAVALAVRWEAGEA